MAIPVKIELRRQPRKQLTGLLPGVLKTEDGQGPLNAKAVDISSHGLGLLLDCELSESHRLQLHLKHKVITLKIIWRQPDLGRESRFRYGVETLDNAIDLIDIFQEGGCLK